MNEYLERLSTFKPIKQATVLKFAALAIAAPRYMGAFAAGIGIEALSRYHWLADVEVYSGGAMAILEGFAMAFVLSKWRVLRVGSLSWWVLLVFASLLGIALPLIAAPYLLIEQNGQSISTLFANHYGLQIAWSILVAGVPVLIIMAVGFADVDEAKWETSEASASETATIGADEPTAAPRKTRKISAPKSAKKRTKGEKTKEKALEIVAKNPAISGADLARELDKHPSTGRKLKAELLPLIETVETEPVTNGNGAH